MPVTPAIGLLPLYLELYDRTLPAMRESLEPFKEEVANRLQGCGLRVVSAPLCRLEEEVESAISWFNASEVDLLVTLHLAYSPSLESVRPLKESGLPILMLDTTLDRSFGLDVDPIRLLYNHGIHGLQDLASVLRREGLRPIVVAGHLSDPSLLERVGETARAAVAAKRLRSTRALRVGPTFHGMGDFQVEDEVLAECLGIEVTEVGPEALLADTEEVGGEELEAECDLDRRLFDSDIDAEVHRRSNRLGLGLRRYLERNGYTAFSLNFLSFHFSEGPLATVPFLECSKAMARGIGYAGEGDVLTAALVGSLQSAIGGVTFTEAFCPDWEGGTLFLSHMGEVNPELAAGKPRLYEKDFSFTRTRNPAILTCAPRPGSATLVNLAPGPDRSFNLITARVEILGDGTHPDIQDWIRAWVRPEVGLEAFLETYSQEFGGTHHCALMLGDHVGSLRALAGMCGFRPCPIGPKGNDR